MFANARRFVRLARVIGASSGKQALRNALPFYLTLAIVALLIFAGNGLDAKTITDLAIGEPVVFVLFACVWALASLPAARILVCSRELFFLRVLPIPRQHFLILLTLGLCIVHAPWLVLWVRGAHAGTALAAGATVMTLQVHALGGLKKPVDGVTLALALPALVVEPSAWTAPFALVSFGSGLRQAWIRAPEPRAQGHHAILPGGRFLALTSALAVSVYRGQASLLLRATLFALAACTIAILGFRNNEIQDPEMVVRVTLFIWGPASVFGAVGLAGPLLRAEARARWLLDLYGIPGLVRAGAAAGLLALGAATCGATLGVVVGAAVPLHASLLGRVALHAAGGGAAWAALAMGLVRLTRSGTGRESSRLGLWLALIASVSLTLLILWPLQTVPVLMAGGLLLTLLTARTSLHVTTALGEDARC